MNTTALPAGGLHRRATVTRRTPVILSSFIDAYSTELQCSRKAAAWELREVFDELAAWQKTHGNTLFLDRRICWVGTVANPATPRGLHKIAAHHLATYFERNMLADGAPVEFVECSTLEGKPRTASDAAVAFNPEELAHLLAPIDRPAPAFLLREPAPVRDQAPAHDDIPTGRRLDSTRRLAHGLMEIAANAAKRDRESEFCKRAARLNPSAPNGTSARHLLKLARELDLDEFPGSEAIKSILG